MAIIEQTDDTDPSDKTHAADKMVCLTALYAAGSMAELCSMSRPNKRRHPPTP